MEDGTVDGEGAGDVFFADEFGDDDGDVAVGVRVLEVGDDVLEWVVELAKR